MAVTVSRLAALVLAFFSILGRACDSNGEPGGSVAKLGKQTHIHGISVDPTDTSRVLLATHDGLSSASTDGVVRRVSRDGFDLMGFASNPSDPDVLLASGHSKRDGNLGLIFSPDGGRTWELLSKASVALDDFHHIVVSHLDPQLIFAANGNLYSSRDGGNTWEFVAPLPRGLVDLTTSSIDHDRLYAATEEGSLFSVDGGITWQQAHASGTLATLAQSAADGGIFVFIPGIGLLRAQEPSLEWVFVSNDFAGRSLLHLAVDQNDARRMFAVTDEQKVIASHDKGRSWAPLGEPSATTVK